MSGLIFHDFPDFLKNEDRRDIVLFIYPVLKGNEIYYLPRMIIACTDDQLIPRNPTTMFIKIREFRN